MYRALIFSVLASPAWAICPVADDLQTGIRLTADDGAVETYVAQTPDIVELTVTYDGGYSDKSLLGKGVYLLAVEEFYHGQKVHGSGSTYAYQDPVDAMPDPAPHAIWRTRAIVDGADEDKITASWDAPVEMTYGDCRYTVIPGEITYSGANYRQTEGLHYLPELGFAYLAFSQYEHSGQMNEYQIITISAVESGE